MQPQAGEGAGKARASTSTPQQAAQAWDDDEAMSMGTATPQSEARSAARAGARAAECSGTPMSVATPAQAMDVDAQVVTHHSAGSQRPACMQERCRSNRRSDVDIQKTLSAMFSRSNFLSTPGLPE